MKISTNSLKGIPKVQVPAATETVAEEVIEL